MQELNIKEMTVTDIQFFDNTHQVPVNELESETVKAYSANVIFDDKVVIQLSGNQNEAHRPTVPTSNEYHWNNESLQDIAFEQFDISDVIEALEVNGVENNFDYLSENGEAI